MSGIKFVDYDSESVIATLVAGFEEVLGETLQPSDERRIFLNQLAQVIVGIKANINDTGNQVLLRYARGEALDAIGEMLGVERLPASPAKCTLKFTLSAAQSVPVTIPKGTRATPDGNLYFATDSDLVILAGELYGNVTATSVGTGVAYNGFVAGQVKYIVDNASYLKGVENSNATSGGTDEEDDESLRERIRLVPESFSTAGCSESYVYWAKTASTEVGDVSVHSPSAGAVNVYIIKADGSVPSSTDQLLETVLEVVSARDKRPLTDNVSVLPPTKSNYAINFSYYISKDDETKATSIQAEVNKAVEKYIAWQGEKIGRDINPDKLRNLVLNAGASRVTMTSPSYTTLDNTKIAALNGSYTASFAGFSE